MTADTEQDNKDGSAQASGTTVQDGTVQQAPAEDSPPMNATEEWTDFFKTLALAFALTIIFRIIFLDPFNIPSGSMKPTLLVGDYLFVNKPAYGYSKHSFPFSFAPFEGRVLSRGNVPERGDVIVFRLPKNTSIAFIKRVIGLPGDTVQMINGELFINRRKVPRMFLGKKKVETDEGREITVMEYEEYLPGGVKHLIYEIGHSMELDNTDEFTVPSGHYFAMGDNRDSSQDSRVQAEVGFIPLDNIVGRASFLFFSTNGTARAHELHKWPKAIRYDRLFKRIMPKPDKK
jgi:signal peptidase I